MVASEPTLIQQAVCFEFVKLGVLVGFKPFRRSIYLQEAMSLTAIERREGLPECSFWRCAAVDAEVRSTLPLLLRHHLEVLPAREPFIDTLCIGECKSANKTRK